MLYEVKNGEIIYDVAVICYGDAQKSVKLCTDNGITITDSIDGLKLVYDEKLKANIIARNNAYTYIQVPTDETYVIKQNQSNYDLCLHYGYTLDGYANFLKDSGLGANKVNNVGTQIVVTKQNDNLINYTFATLYDDENIIPPILSGIGWMTIESTFIVG
jgi:hypothetical protein